MSTLNAAGDPSLSEGIGRRLMTPGGSVAPGIAPEIFPCVVLESDRPETRWLASEGLYARTAAVSAGGAATRSSMTIVNPLGSNALTIVEGIQASIPSGTLLVKLISWGTTALPFGTNQTALPRDGRIQGRAQVHLITDNTLGVAGGSNQLTLASLEWNYTPWVITPGSALYISPNADNVALTYLNILLRERKVNPSELR